MTEKPIPQALYGCHFCGDEYSHPAYFIVLVRKI